MCEIAILNPGRFDLYDLVDASKEIYNGQRTALGLVAIYDENGEFRYETYRSAQPEETDLWDFYDEHQECYRVIIHGRLATSGSREREGTHPIPIDCPECSVDWVLHNGVIRNDDPVRTRHIATGHSYTGEVDSEIIAHMHGDVPEYTSDPTPVHAEKPSLASQPCYILLGSERMYIYTNTGTRWSPYVFLDSVELYKPARWWRNDEHEGDYYSSLILRPGTEPSEEPEETEVTA